MKTVSSSILLALGTLIILAVLALFAMHGSADNLQVIVDGESITGVPAAGYAFGGAVVGLSIAFFALILVTLILAGVSIFVMLILAAVFIVVVAMLTPLLLPLLLVVGLVMLFKRKKADPAI